MSYGVIIANAIQRALFITRTPCVFNSWINIFVFQTRPLCCPTIWQCSFIQHLTNRTMESAKEIIWTKYIGIHSDWDIHTWHLCPSTHCYIHLYRWSMRFVIACLDIYDYIIAIAWKWPGADGVKSNFIFFYLVVCIDGLVIIGRHFLQRINVGNSGPSIRSFARGLCNTRYPPETNLESKTC